VEASLKAWDVPGAAVAVVKGDRTLFVGGVGVRQMGKAEPVTAETVFPLASCTKGVTATLIAKLVDEKVVSWDEPVRTYLPTFHLSDPATESAVTLRDLMSHRTGIAGNDLLWYRAPWNLDETFRRAAKLPPAGPFRGGYQYSSILVAAAGTAVAAKVGKPWDTLVREKLTAPLGMTGVAFTTKAVPASARAGGHKTGKGGKVESCDWYETTEPNPAGSICLTANDLEKWLKFQISGGKLLLSATALAETHSPTTVIPFEGGVARMNPDTTKMSYGLGWVVFDYRGHLVIGHGGHIDGFKALVTLFPKDNLAIGVLSNRFETRMNQAVTNAIADELLGLPAKDWDAILRKVVKDEAAEKAAALAERNKARRADVPPAYPLVRYAGTYTHEAYGEGKVSEGKGGLVWEWSSFKCPLEHWQGEQFRVTDGPFEDQLIEFRTTLAGPIAIRFEGVIFERK
jgi:CubicO group peptidase (beta-lactamase class C family)